MLRRRMPSPSSHAGRVACGALLCALAACSSESRPETCATFDAGCEELYAPTYEEIYRRTFAPTCARSGVSCHGPGRAGGVVFADRDAAYDRLLSRGLVRPGDPQCSELAARIGSDDPLYRMPPGRALDPGERCAIQKWIAAGAPR